MFASFRSHVDSLHTAPLARWIRRYSDARADRTGTDGALLAPVAQRIEQQPSNLSVVGSSPTGGAKHGSD
jgi:hypothetical protein